MYRSVGMFPYLKYFFSCFASCSSWVSAANGMLLKALLYAMRSAVGALVPGQTFSSLRLVSSLMRPHELSSAGQQLGWV